MVLLRSLLLLVSVLTLMFSADPPTSAWTDGVAVQVAPQAPAGAAVVEQTDPGRAPANPAEPDGPPPVLSDAGCWNVGRVSVFECAGEIRLRRLEQPRAKHDVRVERERGPPAAAKRAA